MYKKYETKSIKKPAKLIEINLKLTNKKKKLKYLKNKNGIKI